MVFSSKSRKYLQKRHLFEHYLHFVHIIRVYTREISPIFTKNKSCRGRNPGTASVFARAFPQFCNRFINRPKTRQKSTKKRSQKPPQKSLKTSKKQRLKRRILFCVLRRKKSLFPPSKTRFFGAKMRVFCTTCVKK